MKKVLAEIMRQKRLFARLPLFEFMRDEALTPKQRLAFYPAMAHFVMSFGDLNKFVLRDESSADEYQQMVNTHTYEDDHHWPWYIEDFRKLGFSGARTSTGMLNLMWGEDTKANRQLLYSLTRMINTVGTDHRTLAQIELTPDQQAQALEMVTEVFTLFTAWTEEMLRFAKAELQKRQRAPADPAPDPVGNPVAAALQKRL